MDAVPYPVFLCLEGRSCLVVGGGVVAWRKTASLLASGARVTLVAPRIDPPPADLENDPRLTLRVRPFHPTDLEAQTLVVAATDDRRAQVRIARAARAAGVLANVVDRPRLCDFLCAAVLRRGDLQVAVSTSGRFPLLASRLRDRLAAILPPPTTDAVHELARARVQARHAAKNGGEPAPQRLERLVTPELLALLETGDVRAIQRRIRSWSRTTLGVRT